MIKEPIRHRHVNNWSGMALLETTMNKVNESISTSPIKIKLLLEVGGKNTLQDTIY
jgi:hypothetical protein